MSKEAIFLYDQEIPNFDRNGYNTRLLRFSTPTKIIATLGTGRFNINSGLMALSAMVVVRKCVVVKGFIHSPKDPIEGIHLDGGITIVDESGETRTVGEKIWTLSDNTDSANPDKALEDTIMGTSKDLASRVAMIIEGYRRQEEAHAQAISDGLRRARGDALEARDGTFGRGGY